MYYYYEVPQNRCKDGLWGPGSMRVVLYVDFLGFVTVPIDNPKP